MRALGVCALTLALGVSASHATPPVEPVADMEEVQGPTLPPPRPAPPPVAPEIGQLGKQLSGTWTCKGSAAGKLDVRTILDGAWLEIKGALVVDGATVKLAEYRTYDAIGKQWTRLAFAPGGYQRLVSTGDDGGTWTWSTDAWRVREQLRKNQINVAIDARDGERWTTFAYNLTCSK